MKALLRKIIKLLKKDNLSTDRTNGSVSTKIDGGLTEHEIKQYLIHEIRKKYNYNLFIETGTYLGDMVEVQRNHFSKVYSIELGTHLYNDAVQRFKNFDNVEILHGDSGKILKKLINKINEPAIFWLDGHYSEGITARGEKDCPIYEELNGIFQGTPLPHIFLIDDARLFVGKNDYPTLAELKDYISTFRKSFEFYVTSDIIVVALV